MGEKAKDDGIRVSKQRELGFYVFCVLQSVGKASQSREAQIK